MVKPYANRIKPFFNPEFRKLVDTLLVSDNIDLCRIKPISLDDVLAYDSDYSAATIAIDKKCGDPSPCSLEQQQHYIEQCYFYMQCDLDGEGYIPQGFYITDDGLLGHTSSVNWYPFEISIMDHALSWLYGKTWSYIYSFGPQRIIHSATGAPDVVLNYQALIDEITDHYNLITGLTIPYFDFEIEENRTPQAKVCLDGRLVDSPVYYDWVEAKPSGDFNY